MTRTSLLLCAMLVAACGSREPYVCTSSAQCVSNGAPGVCGPLGFCAFSDSDCPSGYRYEPNASRSCTELDAGVPDAPPACGAIGQACCANGPSCNDGTCSGGTCRSCVSDRAFGRRFGCMLKADHTVWCAGENLKGQLGFGLAGVNSATPMQVRDNTGKLIADATALAAGAEFTCAVRANGTVWCWGGGAPAAYQITMANSMPLTGMVAISAGYGHSCALGSTGDVWCWGGNGSGQLGDGTTNGRGQAAQVLVAPAGMVFTGALDIALGRDTSCVHKASSEIWCWGSNANGQFGDGTLTPKLNPIKLRTSPAFGMGHYAICTIQADTTIACAGLDRHAVLGIGIGNGYNDGNHAMPVQVLTAAGGTPVMGAAQVAILGGSGSCAIMQDRSVYCWGDGQYGQTGTGRPERVPARVRYADGTPLSGVDRLVAGWPHVCAHETSGEWVCWGRNSEGELGDGGFVNRGYPSVLRVSCP